MECPVCLETRLCQQLACGHGVCRQCIKAWTIKGCNDGCPMCRAPMHYKGQRGMEQRWFDECVEEQYTTSLNNIFEEIIEGFFEDAGPWDVMADMMEIQNTFNILKEEGFLPEEIEDLICGEGFCIGRRLKMEYYDDPVKEQIVSWRPVHCNLKL